MPPWNSWSQKANCIETRAATIDILDTYATVWGSSPDGLPITRSQRLLSTHVTDLQTPVFTTPTAIVNCYSIGDTVSRRLPPPQRAQEGTQSMLNEMSLRNVLRAQIGSRFSRTCGKIGMIAAIVFVVWGTAIADVVEVRSGATVLALDRATGEWN